jgi:hypothetical protein
VADDLEGGPQAHAFATAAMTRQRRQLCLAQGGGHGRTVEQVCMEGLEEARRLLVADAPQAGHDSGHTRGEEGPGQARDAVSGAVAAVAGVARREHDQTGGLEIRVIEISCGQEAGFGSRHRGEHQTRAQRCRLGDPVVAGEMHDVILAGCAEEGTCGRLRTDQDLRLRTIERGDPRRLPGCLRQARELGKEIRRESGIADCQRHRSRLGLASPPGLQTEARAGRRRDLVILDEIAPCRGVLERGEGQPGEDRRRQDHPALRRLDLFGDRSKQSFVEAAGARLKIGLGASGLDRRAQLLHQLAGGRGGERRFAAGKVPMPDNPDQQAIVERRVTDHRHAGGQRALDVRGRQHLHRSQAGGTGALGVAERLGDLVTSGSEPDHLFEKAGDLAEVVGAREVVVDLAESSVHRDDGVLQVLLGTRGLPQGLVGERSLREQGGEEARIVGGAVESDGRPERGDRPHGVDLAEQASQMMVVVAQEGLPGPSRGKLIDEVAGLVEVGLSQGRLVQGGLGVRTNEKGGDQPDRIGSGCEAAHPLLLEAQRGQRGARLAGGNGCVREDGVPAAPVRSLEQRPQGEQQLVGTLGAASEVKELAGHDDLDSAGIRNLAGTNKELARLLQHRESGREIAGDPF